jgi:hypothetical protein
MIKKILILISFIASAIVLNHFYKPSNSLSLNSNEITLKVADNIFSLPYKSRKNIPLHLSIVDIKRAELGTKEEKIYVESATTEPMHEFNYASDKAVSMLFNAKRIISIFKSDELEALQMILANGEIINMFISPKESTELSFAYGFSNATFSKAIDRLVGKKVELKDTFTLTKPLAIWSAENLTLNSIISSVDY